MVDIPKIKKKIGAFLIGEEGKISKESLVKAGTFVSALAVSSALSASDANAECVKHANTFTIDHDMASHDVTTSHTHHGSHTSHSSHGSHGSHGQW